MDNFNRMKILNKPIILLLILAVALASCSQPEHSREKIDLNGKWEIAKTDSFPQIPASFESRVPVPGLVDLATPAIDTSSNYDEGVYWYKTKFSIEKDYPKRIQLEIGKAKYHTRVYLNGRFVGENVYCFTPGRFNVRPFLNSPGEMNELMIGVGVAKNIPDTVIWGHDFEKLTYIPGIYDDVSLILAGYPFIRNIQTVPLIEEEKVRIVTGLERGQGETPLRIKYEIKELESGNVVAKGLSKDTDFSVSLPDCRLWTPESPFLYELTLATNADKKTVRFGMRSFAFDAESGRALLNGKPFFMRGTNVCIFRFFEDPDRGTLPWDDEWIIRLHKQFKNMHWNAVRYCIGLPPERWYEIADSLGFLIQNEYPVWTGVPGGFERIYPKVKPEHLANEFRTWLPEHWNHPGVVIWDAQNESVTDVTNGAIDLVRDMDLSGRPWENGWSEPIKDTDPVEAHPYLFLRYSTGDKPSEEGPLADLLSEFRIPDNDVTQWNPPENGDRYPNPVIINEYAWLWLNRDGSTTTLTDKVYDVAFGKNLTREERIYLYTRHLGMLTEYWRAHRYCAGILHFCGLGYSRPEEPRGQTSDHFIDIKNLVLEPRFVEYVKPAFAPVGLMIDFWEKDAAPGAKKNIKVYAINDMDTEWQGDIILKINKGDQDLITRKREIIIPSFGKKLLTFEMKMPSEKGTYTLIASIDLQGEPVKSIREISLR